MTDAQAETPSRVRVLRNRSAAETLLAETGHEICQGDRCLVIKENMTKYTYWVECATLILRKAQEELSQLSLELERPDEASRSASG